MVKEGGLTSETGVDLSPWPNDFERKGARKWAARQIQNIPLNIETIR